MKISFSKYHGAGNDFIIIDNREGTFLAETNLIKKLCHRQFGVGADGLMLLEKDLNADFRMRYFNSDGNESTMCGNGGRCISVFANKLGLVDKRTRFMGIDGEHFANIDSLEWVRLKMQDVTSVSIQNDFYLMDTGSPHCVMFVDDINSVDVYAQGKTIRLNTWMEKGGVNVNFVQITPNGLKIRTYERGVEAETLACGTGAVAASVAANIKLKSRQHEFKLSAPGGELLVTFDSYQENRFSNIWLQGPVAHVFNGEIEP